MAPWSESAEAGLGQLSELWAISRSQGRFVLSGQPEPAATWSGQLWWSDDGLRWQRATMPAEMQPDRVLAITSTSSGFVALSPDYSGESIITYVLHSEEGREWSTAGSFQANGTELARIGGRILAFGTGNVPSDPWYSDDQGENWNPVETASGRAVSDGLLALHEADGYLWAVRSDDPLDDMSIRTPTELWRTADGLDWEKVADLPGSIAVNGAAIGSGPLGWVITARRTTVEYEPLEFSDEWFAWHSPDGTSWQPSRAAPRYVDQILADGQGFLGLGHNHGSCCAIAEQDVRQLIWTSADGMYWQQLPKDGWHGREIDFVTLLSERVSVVGIDWLLHPGRDYRGFGVTWTVDRSALAP